MSRVIYTFYRPRSRFSPIFFSFFSLFFFFLKCVRVLCLLVSTGPHLMSSDFTCTNPFGAASGEHVAVMEWRERSAVSCDEAYAEAQRWVEAVTKKKFGSEDFRSALENGVLLCDLINKITPGVIRRVNRLPTPIAGLDNLNVFLKACRKLGLKEAQLFHPGDLQDLSTRVTVKHQETDRRLKNVLITIYWLGRRAQCDRFYDGPFLNLKAFEGLLGTALYKALQESSGQKGGNVRDSGFGDSWCSEREELFQLREGGGGGGGGHRRDDSLDSLDSLSISSDSTLKGSSEGFCSDAEADSVFRMTENKSGLSYRRSVTLTPKPTSQFNQFLPTKDKSTAYVPAPLRKKRAERNEDSRRSWANLTYAEDQATLTRSKSASDIQVEPNIDRQSRYEELQKHRQQTKDTEDKWQDDLSKWKNRRRSVNSDIVKKKEEREKTEESTSGSRRAKTFKEMQEERENKGKNSIGGRLGSLSYLDNEDVFDKAVISPRTRTLPARSYTIDTPYYSSESPEPPLKEDEPRAASPATGRAAFPPTSQGVETLDSPAGRDTTTTSTPTSRSFFHRAQSPAPAAEAPLPVSVRTGTVETVETAAAVSLRKVPEPRRPLLRTQTEAGAPSSGSLYEQQPQPVSMEPKPPGVSRVSASLPRSYQKPDSARLTSIVAPRPFGTQSSRLTYVPRALTVDDPQKRVNGDAVASKKSAVPSRFQQFMTSEDELQSQSSSAHSSEDEEEEEEEDKTSPQMVSSSQSISTQSVSSPQRISPVPPQVKTGAPVSPAPAKETSQENFCESRISLNQKPNSSRDFGFQAAWDSTGACVASIQPGSPAEMCQLQAGDEVLTVNGHQVAEMSYPDWKSCMEEALQEGSLIMDIRHHGRNNWDRDQPPMPFKIHKTINLTSVDHPILLGSPDANAVSSSLDFTSHASVEKLLPKEAPAHPVLDMASNGVNGGFREQAATMTNKESEPISLTNLKRRSEFFEKGGSESAMPDIPVPSIIPSSSRWSWDPEEERRRQEKWQKEQERLLQEKYKRDQEKLQEEWLKDQEEVAKSVGQQEPGSLEVSTGAGGPLSSLSPVGQPATPPWEEQERKRKEEHERQRQAEERRKREEEERELRRLQEERETRDRQQRQEEERKSRDEEELRWQRRKEEEREEERRRRQEAEEQQRRERERALAEQQQQQQRAASFANVPPSLSFTDRMKSKSSPQLDEEEKPQRKGVFVQPGVMAPRLLEEQARSARDKEARSQRAASELEMERRNILNIMRYREPERVTGGVAAEKKGQQSASQAEQERQQILNEMKKKTPLLMDKSWIRQQSSTTSTTTEESDVPPMRRGESLDNLDASYNSWRSSWTPRSNSYGQSAARPNSALSGSTAFYGGGSAGVQRPPSSALPSSYSMGSLRAGAGTPSSPWSRQSPSPSPSSPSPTTSPEPTSEGGPPQQRSRSVSGRKVCTFCDTPLGKGAAMIIESLGLCYHLSCFKCIECKSDLGGSAAGAEVRIRNKHLYCNTCYTRCKAGQPTTM
ncbi:LIM domain only protein 7 isoform X3 [Cyclopterus lumpus]|uniref:LIM domain only protein 7 isoform X3 n=1 Tax=Cyclopterus lumpus TaxID=8103 RepID=UPI0014860F27|nr:LIM domain only protein 7 isoform X3 [Cyclopterus lumpus]